MEMHLLEMLQEILQEILQETQEINLQAISLQTTQTQICQNQNPPLKSQLKKQSRPEKPEQLLQEISQIDLKKLFQLHLQQETIRHL